MAFDSLSEKLQNVFKNLRSKGRLTEDDVKAALKEVKMALLEADVNFKVVKQFVKDVQERAIGQDVMNGLNPGQMVIKIVNEEMVKLMGSETTEIKLQPGKALTVIMMEGLQGAGKTTTAAKLAGKFKLKGKKVLLTACDIYRPGAIEQLQINGEKQGVEVFSMGDKIKPVNIAKAAIEHAAKNEFNIVILDTAGRLHIDDDMMAELQEIKENVTVHQTVLVVDAMTGQDAVNVAKMFDEKVGIDGVILTKLDGDTRGGAALSIRAVTGKPILYVGMGEKLSDLEQFYPDRMASRILGMGDVLTLIEKAQAAGGYLNFFLNREKFISETVSSALDAGEDWGKSDMGKGKTVLVEYSSPNIAKPFHIGHLFSTAVGNSLSKIYKHLGYDVQSLNHLGDWGTQFGKLICAYKRWGVKEVIEKDPINELLKIYVKFHEEAEKHPELDDEARGYFKKLEDGDEETTALWTYFRDISLVEFKRVYDMLGVKFDSYNGEAFYSDKMDEVVDILRDKGLLTESDGAQVVDLSELNIPPCIVLKSDGATIYATRDIAAALYRHRTYDFYKNIYVVGIPQSLHFKQIFAVMKKAGWDWADDCVHVGFGLVKLPGKNMSTRHGDVVFLEDVLNESIEKTKEIIEKNGSNVEDIEDASKKIGIGAILYTFLKNSREKDIIFSWDTMLDFEGESAPYCQYGYARGRSILRKAEGIDYSNADFSKAASDEAYSLVKQINGFGDAVKDAADKNEPFYINRYVTNLTKSFNKFYNTNPIMKDDVDEETKKARLAIVDATTKVIKTALGLLGIETVESM